MAYSSITYADKVENNGATPAGRFGADDLNEIKTVTNANGADFDGRIDLLEAGGGGINNLTSSGHVGDGTTVTFPLSFTPQTEVPQAFVVGIDGVLQSPIDAYTVSTTTDAITFSSAPPVNSEIVVSTANVLTGTDISASTIISTGSTTTRLLVDRFADTVNVKDFGAVGDGVTDDTAAIQAAVDSNASSVFVPSGRYAISRVNVNSPVRIVGESRELLNGSVLIPYDTTGQSASNTMINIQSDDVSIGNIGFDLIASPNPNDENLDQGTPYYAVRVLEKSDNLGYARFEFKNLHFDKGRNQLKLENSEDVLVEDCIFENADNGWGCASRSGKRQTYNRITSRNHNTANTSVGGADGIKISTDPDTYVDDIKITNCTFTGNSRDGIDINLGSGRNIIISNNLIEDNDLTGIEVKKGILSALVGVDGEYQDLIISDNIIKMNSQLQVCINCQNTYSEDGAIYRSVNIFNNHLEYILEDGSSTDPAIKLEGITGGRVLGNSIVNARVGIGVRELGSGSVISNNIIHAWYGIQLQTAGVTDLTILSNKIVSTDRCIDTNAGTDIRIKDNELTSDLYGIFLGVGQDYDITGNIIKSNDYAIRVDDTFSGGALFSSNIITSGSYGLYISTGSNYTIVDNYISSDTWGIRFDTGAGNNHIIKRNDFHIDAQSPVYLSSGFSGTGVEVVENTGVITDGQEFIDNDSAATFKAYRNLRGDATTTPTMSASTGDVIYNSDPTAGSYSRWVYTSAGSWKGVDLIEA